jgi:hypothetical protein
VVDFRGRRKGLHCPSAGDWRRLSPTTPRSAQSSSLMAWPYEFALDQERHPLTNFSSTPVYFRPRYPAAQTLTKSVLRCFEWVVASSSRQPQVELACQQVDHGLEVAAGAIAARLGLGGFHQAVDAFDQAIGDLAVEPAQDALPMTLDGTGSIDDRRQPAVSGPEVPGLEVAGARRSGGLLIKFLKGEPDLIGPPRLEMARGQAFQCRAVGPTGRSDCAARGSGYRAAQFGSSARHDAPDRPPR